MDHLAAAIESDPSDPLPRTHYGRLLALSMEYRDALPHLERAAALRPDDPQVWLDLATVYQKMLVLDLSWEARRRADTLAEGREIRQGEMGFWVVDGNSIFP
jgi:Flp pilus assembly protein TadD